MKSKTDQIRALVHMNTFQWAVRQLAHPNDINNKKFTDFISITERELIHHLVESGFNQGALAASECEERICVVEQSGLWLIYYYERGQRHDVTRHESKFSAATEVARRLIMSAKVSLNHRYKNAHPELKLPNPSEM